MNQPNMGMYQNFNQHMQNPYMERINQLQQYQQNLQMQPIQPSGTNQMPIGLNCRIVDDFNSIVANDVPMDGNGAIFMKRDGSEMQHRNWSANGTIVTTSYLPILEQNKSDGSNIPQTDFNILNEDFRALREEISDRFDRLEKSIGSKTTTSRNKKEVNADE